MRKACQNCGVFLSNRVDHCFLGDNNQEVWLGLVVSELNLGSLPLWVWPGGERGFAAGNCRWSIPVIVIFRYLFY